MTALFFLFRRIGRQGTGTCHLWHDAKIQILFVKTKEYLENKKKVPFSRRTLLKNNY